MSGWQCLCWCSVWGFCCPWAGCTGSAGSRGSAPPVGSRQPQVSAEHWHFFRKYLQSWTRNISCPESLRLHLRKTPIEVSELACIQWVEDAKESLQHCYYSLFLPEQGELGKEETNETEQALIDISCSRWKQNKIFFPYMIRRRAEDEPSQQERSELCLMGLLWESPALSSAALL